MNLKNGTFTLYIPAVYQKEGRQFAILAIDVNGKVMFLADQDIASGTITVPVNHAGYAFELLYKD